MLSAVRRCSASIPRAFAAGALASRSSISRITPQVSRLTKLTQGTQLRGFQHVARWQSQSALAEDSQDGAEGLITQFQELADRDLIHANVIEALTRDMGLTDMTEVQSATINQALTGSDMYVSLPYFEMD